MTSRILIISWSIIELEKNLYQEWRTLEMFHGFKTIQGMIFHGYFNMILIGERRTQVCKLSYRN